MKHVLSSLACLVVAVLIIACQGKTDPVGVFQPSENTPVEETPAVQPLPVFPDQVLVGAGDIAQNNQPGTAAKTAELVKWVLRSFFGSTAFTLGDNNNNHPFENLLTTLFRDTWGQDEIKKDLYATIDHDEDASIFYNLFGERGGAGNDGNYSRDVGAWLEVHLNSNNVTAGSIEWLEQELKENPDKHVLAMFHHPLFSSGLHGGNMQVRYIWEKMLEHGRAQRAKGTKKCLVVFNGHQHSYERFAPQNLDGEYDVNGIIQFTVGTGGAKLMPFIAQRLNSMARGVAHGVLKAVLGNDRMEYEFIPIPGSNFRDSGTIMCG